jgi:hypothetical protein
VLICLPAHLRFSFYRCLIFLGFGQSLITTMGSRDLYNVSHCLLVVAVASVSCFVLYVPEHTAHVLSPPLHLTDILVVIFAL